MHLPIKDLSLICGVGLSSLLHMTHLLLRTRNHVRKHVLLYGTLPIAAGVLLDTIITIDKFNSEWLSTGSSRLKVLFLSFIPLRPTAMPKPIHTLSRRSILEHMDLVTTLYMLTKPKNNFTHQIILFIFIQLSTMFENNATDINIIKYS